jgi:hypothetical protein
MIYDKEPIIDKLLNQYDLDFVLRSVHIIKGKNIGDSKTHLSFLREKN